MLELSKGWMSGLKRSLSKASVWSTLDWDFSPSSPRHFQFPSVNRQISGQSVHTCSTSNGHLLLFVHYVLCTAFIDRNSGWELIAPSLVNGTPNWEFTFGRELIGQLQTSHYLIQQCDFLPTLWMKFRRLLPGIRIWQVLHINFNSWSRLHNYECRYFNPWSVLLNWITFVGCIPNTNPIVSSFHGIWTVNCSTRSATNFMSK